ncbi:MAG: CapA family protein, partial [Blastocatellia bacterium]
MNQPHTLDRRAFLGASVASLAGLHMAMAAPRDLKFTAVGQSLILLDVRPPAYAGYAQVRERIRRADLAFTNLEVAIKGAGVEMPNDPNRPAGNKVGGPPVVLDALKDMGFGLLSLSNNHADDLGVPGILSTIAETKQRGFGYAGTGRNLAEAAAPGYLKTPQGKIALVAKASSSNIECAPLVVDGVIYLTSAFSRVIALDAATGREIWKHDPFEGVRWKPGAVNRGAAYWSEGTLKRIVLATYDGRLISLDARTGQPDAKFGAQGVVNLRTGIERDLTGLKYGATSPPAIFENLAIVGFQNDEGPGPSAPGDIRAFDLRNGFPAGTLDTIQFDPTATAFRSWSLDFPQAYTYHWNLNVQHEFKFLLAEVGYSGTRGSQLPVNVDINAPRPAAGAVAARRPLPGFGTITRAQPLNNSHYHAFQARAERRFSKGFALLAAYTLSKSIDLGGEQLIGQDQQFRDTQNLALERSLSLFDMRHRACRVEFHDGCYAARGPFLRCHALAAWSFTMVATPR